MADTLTPLERLLATVTHKKPDRPPVFPVMLMQGARELGLSLEEYFSKGEHYAHGQLRLLEKFGHDCVIGVPHVVEDTVAFGATLMYFRNGPPSLGKMVLREAKDARKLTAADPKKIPALQETLHALNILAQNVKGRVPIIGAAVAPFSLPSLLMGAEAWVDLLFSDPATRDPILAHALAVTRDFCIAWANAQIEAGADAIVLADGMASATMITRDEFMQFALPVIRETISQIKGPVVWEGVGSVLPVIDLIAETGAAGIILDYHDDLAAAHQVAAGKITLIGNFNNIAMRRWSPEKMKDEVARALAATGGMDYIVGAQGPEIPLGVSDETIRAMIETTKNFQSA
ncbi:MAG: uroporphyrinogen decarboxylase family protein [Chloroflexi bacterium]|nr:uroporphyrinogen decarboxylase family protein [Chloroflexota bacterium]